MASSVTSSASATQLEQDGRQGRRAELTQASPVPQARSSVRWRAAPEPGTPVPPGRESMPSPPPRPVSRGLSMHRGAAARGQLTLDWGTGSHSRGDPASAGSEPTSPSRRQSPRQSPSSPAGSRGQGQGRAWAPLLALCPVRLVRKPLEEQSRALRADPESLWVRPQPSPGPRSDLAESVSPPRLSLPQN